MLQSSGTTSEVIQTIITIIILALFVLAYRFFGRRFRALKKKYLLPANATITTHQMSERMTGGGGDWAEKVAEVGYTFVVGGKAYCGFIVKRATNEAEAEPLFQKHPIGSIIRIRYAPNHPELHEQIEDAA
jgi:hypothetical protein